MAAHTHVRPQPVCLRHPGGRVRLDGVYGRRDRKRQRFRCSPPDGGPEHVFTEALPRTIAPDGAECWECERPLARHEGPPSPRGYEYTVQEIADALIRVGQGESFASAGREIQALGSRPRRRSSTHRRRRQDSRTVGSWVEVFTPVLWEALRPREWPPIVALDAKGFFVGGRTNDEGEAVQGGTPVFHVFAAMGYDGYEKPVRLAGLRSVPNFRKSHGFPFWVEFLQSLDGELDGAPRQFVCDGDPEIEAAIRAVWPTNTPEVFICHHHLGRNLLNAVNRAVGRDHPWYEAVASIEKGKGPFANGETWRRFVDEVVAHRPKREVQPIRRWITTNGDRLAWQLAHRGGHVVDTSAVEQYLTLVTRQFGYRRASIRNRHRLDLTLELMMLQQRAPARRAAYAHLIREHLAGRGGKPSPQHTHDDLRPRGPDEPRGSLRLTPPPRRRQQRRELAVGPARDESKEADYISPDEGDIPF